MARKRKSRAVEAPQEPEPVQAIEPEPEIEQPEVEETQQTLEEEPDHEPEQPETEETLEDPGVGEEDEEVIEGEEEAEQVEEEEMEEQNDISENNEQESTITDKPSENTVIELNGEGGEGQTMKMEEEEDLEEEPLEKLLEPFTKDQLILLIKEIVAKHPDTVENVNKLADVDPAHRNIFLHGLGWEVTTEIVTAVFEKFGELEDCKLVKDKITGKSKGYCFIRFKHRNGARRALKEPQKLIEGRMTSCQLASAGPVQAPPPTATATVSGPPLSEYTQRKIFVSNVSAELDINKLVEFFSKFGEIEDGPLGLDKQTGKAKGFCLFVYKTVESAKKALAEPHKDFEGQTLHCQQAVDAPKNNNKGGYFPQHGQTRQHQGHQGYNHHPAKKGRFSGRGGGAGHSGGHLMAPSGGFNPTVAPAAIGQAVAALLASQGAGLGIGNLLGGIGAGMNPQGGPPMMNNVGYGGQSSGGGYGGQPGMQGGYGGPQQMGQGGARPQGGYGGQPGMPGGYGR